MRAVLPACRANGVKIVTNMGAANPLAAAAMTRSIARAAGLTPLRIAAVTGDDVLDEARSTKLALDIGGTVADLGNRVVSANETLYTNGPAGGCGAWKSTREVIAIASALAPEAMVRTEIRILEC
jgi:hypothetical protein